MCGEGVDAAHADTVETAAHLVGAFVEFTAGMEHRHDHLECRFVELLVLVHGDTAAVVLHGHRVVFVDGHLYVCTISGHRLVDRVVHRLVDKVVQTLLADVANVHGGTLAHSLQALKHLDVAGRIIVLYVLIFCHLLVN